MRNIGFLFALLMGLFPFREGWMQTNKGNTLQFEGNFVFQVTYTDSRTMVRQESSFLIPDTLIQDIKRVIRDTSAFHLIDPKPLSPILLGIRFSNAADILAVRDLISAWVPNFSKSYKSYQLPVGSEVTIVAMGIDQTNIADYHYRVVLNDSIEVVPWSPIPGLEMRYGAVEPYGRIGSFSFEKQRVLVEVASRKEYGTRDGYIIDWTESWKPGIDQIVVEGASEYGYYNPAGLAKKNGAFPLNGFPLDWSFARDSVRAISVYVSPSETVPYSVYLIREDQKGKDTTMVEWYFHNKSFFRIGPDQIRAPGRYEILIQPLGALGKHPEQVVTRVPFVVEEPQTDIFGLTIREILPYCIGAFLLIALALVLYQRYQKGRLLRAIRQKQQINMKLESIRGQLNPHFLFNAITSIQNLVQKKEVETASHYLTTFASLTRAVLASGGREMNTLTGEIRLLHDYLCMEQLRFGFRYTILETLSVNTDLVELPPLLLQPLAENAVKHGVAHLLDKGEIVIRIYNRNDTLVMEVEDNGKGFEASPGDSRGYGIRLTRERIGLLNQMFPGPGFELSFTGLPQGTRATILIHHWISV